MYIDPQIAPVLEFINASPSSSDATVQDRRDGYRALLMMLGEGPEMASVEHHQITANGTEFATRIYRPEDDDALPVLIYFHGGGWTIGDLDAYDEVCRQLAVRIGCLVVSVDYRLAPEHPFPAAVDDANAALDWVFVNAPAFGGDPKRIAVGGDSAGGNLAVVSALESGDRDLRFQLLLYPSVDMELSATGSALENAEGFILSSQIMRWFSEQYCPEVVDRSDPRASPIHSSNLAASPETIILTASLDPLYDQGEAFADALKAAGTKVHRFRGDGLPHLFVHFHSQVEEAERILVEATDRARRAFL